MLIKVSQNHACFHDFGSSPCWCPQAILVVTWPEPFGTNYKEILRIVLVDINVIFLHDQVGKGVLEA